MNAINIPKPTLPKPAFNKSALLVGALIALCFLWSGTAYISWLYSMDTAFGSGLAKVLSDGLGYVFQALGILAVVLVGRKRTTLIFGQPFLDCAMIIDWVLIAACTNISNPAAVLGFGLAMNLMHGVVAGCYLTRLAGLCSPRSTGLVFGIAYAIGSIGSWFISMPMGGAFISTGYVIAVLAVLVALSIVANRLAPEPGDSDGARTQLDLPKTALTNRALVVAGLCIFMFFVVNQVGFAYPLSDTISGSISIEFTRAFYAVGLIIAGVISSRSRRVGAICCVASMAFPFVAISVQDAAGVATAVWIVAYMLLGFFTVYRTVLFCDIAVSRAGMLCFAGMGLFFGRLGECIGTVANTLIGANSNLQVSVAAIVFVAAVILFFVHYQMFYAGGSAKEEYDLDAELAAFEQRFELTRREGDVLRELVKGLTNPEIAGALFISENTVKTHVKRVLKKSGCANRGDLMRQFKV